CINGFECDSTRCIPVDWRCDGHVDCADQSDEIGCGECESSQTASPNGKKGKKNVNKNSLTKPTLHCGERRCMSSSHVCDGVMDCPWGQDERNCLKLSERNGDIGRGSLEVYHAEKGKFLPACITHWESTLAHTVCSLLGYRIADSSSLWTRASNGTVVESQVETSQQWRLAQKSQINLLKEFQECEDPTEHSTVELTCSEYSCGRRRHVYGNLRAQPRIVGGIEAAPGDWPFLAALLGGPEEIFYCAGV
ncbi:atrial natriuretic peptide-converting enzyme, partial [Cephus cinctus]|uniref:Atrial natriuretic peptide-converting enzyme n=1 Tax=Cephus cinctus TaxID=211228 RepID=A0AAJ7C7L7_CEPCN